MRAGPAGTRRAEPRAGARPGPRLTPAGGGWRVDIRAAYGYFGGDLGSNASRVTKLIDDINSAVDNAKPAVKKPQAPPKALPKTVKK